MLNFNLFSKSLNLGIGAGSMADDERGNEGRNDVMDGEAEREEHVENEEEEEEEEEDEDYDIREPVFLGFVQDPTTSWGLQRQYFPSKAGGSPAWLDPKHIPSSEFCKCGYCGKPLSYLLQVYAPAEKVEEAFHRTLYVFVCKNFGCMQNDVQNQTTNGVNLPRGSVRILRCQLPRNNPYYNFYPPQKDKLEPPLTKSSVLCDWCQTWKAEKRCSKCQLATYCSRDHQVLHWRNGHSVFCNSISQSQSQSEKEKEQANVEKMDPGINSNRDDNVNEVHEKNGDDKSSMRTSYSESLINERGLARVLWVEKEVLVEDEEEEEEAEKDDFNTDNNNEYGDISDAGNESKTKRLLNEYLKRVQKEGEYDADELRGIEEKSEEKKQWVEFQTVLSKSPSQVIRYCWSDRAQVLWPCIGNQPKLNQIPPCKHCGENRIFEFQILPQLLYFLQTSNSANVTLDFGTLVFYTCKNSCQNANEAYIDEFAWIQLLPA